MTQPIAWHRFELSSSEQLQALDAIDAHVKASLNPQQSSSELESKDEAQATQPRAEAVPEPLRRLHSALDSCNSLSKQLDNCVSLLDSIGSSYDAVASRTTALVHNCEDMLYQQTTLQELADKVEKYLEPFTDMEDLARKLGVPFSHQQGGGTVSAAATTTRSNLSADELADITSRLDRVGEFFKEHPEVQANQMYSQWLTRLRHRAASLVVLSAKKAIDSAFREASQQTQAPSRARSETSLENSPIYSRFRAISPRLNKVCTILRHSQEIAVEESVEIILQHFVTRRSELLGPLVKSFIVDKEAEDAAGEDSKLHTLPAVVRRVYASLQRVVQMEVMLFQSAFHTDGGSHDSESDSISPELSDLLELLCVRARDGLRPVIIRQTSLEELCRAVLILHEDIGQQFENLRLAADVRRRLQMVVEATVSDAQERLIYLTDLRIRSEVEYFEPTPADVSYPEVLQQAARVDALAGDGAADQAVTATVGADWYPPLRTTLTVLSRLYNVLELEVFEDIAGHCVGACTAALVRGAEAVKKRSSMLHGNLFLVRHTLLLREQLLPFNIRFTAVERMLDFSSTTTALSKMVANSRSLLRLDPTNALIKFAKEGLPRLEQTQVDGKRKMDESVRLACAQLTSSIVQELAGQLSDASTKLRAFLDVYPGAPTEIVREKLAEFGPDKMQNLARQAFLRPERLKACAQGVLASVEKTMSELLQALNLYITNSATRSVLVRPIQNQFELVIADVQTTIQAILSTASAEVGAAAAQAYTEIDAILSEASNKFRDLITQTA